MVFSLALTSPEIWELEDSIESDSINALQIQEQTIVATMNMSSLTFMIIQQLLVFVVMKHISEWFIQGKQSTEEETEEAPYPQECSKRHRHLLIRVWRQLLWSLVCYQWGKSQLLKERIPLVLLILCTGSINII